MATVKEAVKAARAAFSENYKHSHDYDVAERAAELAVMDRGFNTRKARGWNILNAAMCCARPSVTRLIDNANACANEF